MTLGELQEKKLFLHVQNANYNMTGGFTKTKPLGGTKESTEWGEEEGELKKEKA